MRKKKRKPIPNYIRTQVFEAKGYVCFYCSVDLLTLPKKDRTLDHRQHHFRGGKDLTENLVPCCRSCNAMRHIMEDEEFAEYRALKALNLSRYEMEKAREVLRAKYDLLCA